MKTSVTFLAATFFCLAYGQIVNAEAPGFDFSQWKTTRGQTKDLKDWGNENPSPHRSYYTENSKDCAERWFINLGPLGVCTLMHDRSWAVFDGVREIYPKALTDQHGAVFNAFEVKVVKQGSPAAGVLKEGDLLIKMDDQPLLGAQHMFVGQPMDNKNKRGIEIHAGQLIDKAEGRGDIKVTYLRLPDGIKNKPLTTERAWKTVKEQAVSGETNVTVDLDGSGLLRLRTGGKRTGAKCQQLEIVNEKGQKVVLTPMAKRSDELNQLFELPAGKWTMSATIETKKEIKLTIERLGDIGLPKHLEKYLHTATLKLDPIGSFGSQFDPGSNKARNYSAMLAHRLAVQQNKDGSWLAKSYASKSFYTSVCGLALLSTDNPLYDANIKLAAQYVANAGERDKWSYSNGMWLLFLSEYYLKTKDESILPALKMHVSNIHRFVHSDYTSGHSFAQPGYGGSGYIGGGGMIACGLAVASKTPAVSDKDFQLIDKMLERVQEISPGGKVPYGRSGKSKDTSPARGQAGSCGTGPYFIASLVRGGTDLFVKNATVRYSTAPFGSAENGHATQTLHFVWSCLASANCGEEAHRENMNAYLWKFTTLREFDGFINKNNYRTEYHNGDGVIGEPYWRTAGYLLIMNAHRKNLAITGAPQYRTAPRTLPVVFHRDRAAQNYLLRNWALVEAYLGDAVTPEFSEACKAIRGIKPGPDLGKELRSVMKQHAPAAAKSILTAKNIPKGVPSGQLVELMMGVSFEASCYADLLAADEETIGAAAKSEQKKLAKQIEKKKKKLFEQGKLTVVPHRLKIRPTSRLQKDPEALSAISTIAGSLFKMEGLTIQVADRSRKYLRKPILEKVNTGEAPKKQRKGKVPAVVAKVPGQVAFFEVKTGDQAVLQVKVQYTLAGMPVSYTVPMTIPAPEARNYVPILCQVPVRGTVVDDYSDSYSMLIRLATGHTVGCEQRNHPARYLLAGAEYDFVISPGSVWGHDLRRAKPLTKDHRVAKVISVEGIDNGGLLTDHQYENGIKLDEGNKVITMTLDKEQDIQRVYLAFTALKGNAAPRVPHTFEALVDRKWKLLRRGHISGMMPTIALKTKQVRVTLAVPKGGVRLDEVHMITPAPTSKKPAMSW